MTLPENQIEAVADNCNFKNAAIGKETLVEPDVDVGFRYHKDCGPAHVGNHGILRKGTIIYGDVVIGDYFQTGHYVVVRAKVQIGDYCTVLHHSVLEGLIHFGNGVRIMTNVYIPSRTWFGNNVFVGPGVTFLNEKLPGRMTHAQTPKGATIEDDVVIGGGCIILPGVTIGERSFIAAGSVVTKDIPPKSLVKGVPGVIESLPDTLDMSNSMELTMQPIDLWHPLTPDLNVIDWS